MNYKSLLFEIQNASTTGPASETIIVPSNTRLYNVNLDTRTIEAPEYLSVQSEHYAETVYFLVDRFHDSMDLSQTNCVVQYVTNGESYVYAVPFCDVTTYEDKMIIPWTISSSATQHAGTIRYMIRFYLIDETTVSETGDPSNAEFSFSLNTKDASSQILKTLPQSDFVNDDKAYKITTPEKFFELVNVVNQMIDNATVYWTEV